MFETSGLVVGCGVLVGAGEFHARSLAALESARGLRDDAFLKNERAWGIGMTHFLRMRVGSGFGMPRF